MRPDFLIFSQVTTPQVVGLAESMARELGPTVLHTGSQFASSERALEIWRAPSYDNHSYRSRLRSWAAYVADAFRCSTRVEGNPILLISTNPPFGPYLGWALRKLRGWHYVLRILDVYPDALIGHGIFGPSHPVPRTLGALNRLAFGAADAVVTIGPVMAERVGQYVGRAEVRVIPDWVDTARICPLSKAENWFAREHSLVDKLTVMYSGNLGLTHDLSALFHVAEALQDDASIRFVFVGGGARAAELRETAGRLRNALWLPPQPEEALPFSLAAADIALVTLGKGTEGVSMPSKAYSNMAAGSALLGLARGDSDLRRLIQERACGVCLDVGDAAGIQDALLRFKAEDDLLTTCRLNSRRAAVDHFSSAMCTREYLELFARLRHDARAA